MPRPKIEGLQKHTLNLREGDIQALRELMPNREPTAVIRQLVSNFVDKLQSASKTPKEPVDI